MKKLYMLMIALVFVLAYQNCTPLSPVQFTDASSGKVTNNTGENGDNGRPYDGKIYVLTGADCTDGTNIQARIVLKTSTSADLVRKNCTEIAPVVLSSNDFQLNASDSSQLVYDNQIFHNTLVGTVLDLSQYYSDSGFAWMSNTINFPGLIDTNANKTQSTLRLYEDGMPLGPAHSLHADIRNLGGGRFSHFDGGTGPGLRFSSSDNTDPRSNGRTYTWTVK